LFLLNKLSDLNIRTCKLTMVFLVKDSVSVPILDKGPRRFKSFD